KEFLNELEYATPILRERRCTGRAHQRVSRPRLRLDVSRPGGDGGRGPGCRLVAVFDRSLNLQPSRVLDVGSRSTGTGHLLVSASGQDGACDCRRVVPRLFDDRRDYDVGDYF